MPKMVIFSTLFFNKVGNQSMLESIKNYANTHDVVLITSADREDTYYLSESEAYDVLPSNVEIYFVTNSHKKLIKFFSSLLSRKSKVTKSDEITDDLVNMRYSIFNIMSFKLSFFLSFLTSVLLKIRGRLSDVEIVCGYEIGGVVPATYYRKFFRGRTLAKLQGTVLYDAILNNKNASSRDFYIDHLAYELLKSFDAVSMTNDGTKGDLVLKHYGVDMSRVLFVSNGISENVVNYKSNYQYRYESQSIIKICTISRLVGWKRVYLSVRMIGRLVNVFKVNNVCLDIYGFGTPAEVELLERLIDELDLRGVVTLKGVVDHKEVPAIMASYDFLISLYRMTNVTNPVLESIYLNIPVVTLEDDSLKSLVAATPERNIYYFKEESEEQVVTDIARFFSEVDLSIVRDRRVKCNGYYSDEILSWGKRAEKEIMMSLEPVTS